jgi:hypothetical protein
MALLIIRRDELARAAHPVGAVIQPAVAPAERESA